MKVNSSKQFRKWVKEKEHRSEVDENFMGYGYDEGNTHTHGFFNLFHGIKDDIARYLTPRLDLAQDNQAIYEFVQNAADCKSTHFFSFWNDEYFLVCNNGEKFTYAGLESILNEGQSTKRSPDSIGRYGVGFKIIHRLVGEHNGLQEIMKKDCGPIIFSWNTRGDLLDFLSGSSIELLNNHDDNVPYLLKILLTNFPSDVEETIFDTDHRSRVVFHKEELVECQSYAKQCLDSYLDEEGINFEQGSIFFLRLGKGKKSVLDNDYNELSGSLSYSMNTLKKMSSLCVNGKEILKKELNIEDGYIATGSESFQRLTIDEKYREYDVKYSFGYIPFVDVKDLSELFTLKNSPNFYKFFPISDEINSFALFLHCDTFGISTSRRSLDCSEHNKTILTSMAKFIKQKLEEYKQTDIKKYLQLFISILLSDRPIKSNNSWLGSVFYQPLLEYIKHNIPTCNKSFRPSIEVKIKGTSLMLSPSEVGANYDWFIYDKDKDSLWQRAAMDTTRIGLQVRDIKGLIKDGSVDKWNKWIDNHPELIDSLLEELREVECASDFAEKLKCLKFFSTKSGHKTWNEIISNNDLILLSDNTAQIKDVLEKLGFECTNEVFNENHPLWRHLQKKNEEFIFHLVCDKIFNVSLTREEKIRLVTSNFDGIGDEKIKNMRIFNNQNGSLSIMKQMLPYEATYPLWMSQYVINKNEYSHRLDRLLVPSNRVFEEIVWNNYHAIIQSISDDKVTAMDTLFAQFERDWTDSFTERLLNNYGANESLLTIIEARKGSQETYLRRLPAIYLDVDKDYLPSSFEYRVLKLSINSERNAEILKDKIVIGNKTLRQYSYADTITIKQFKGRSIADIVMSLSDILPHMQTSDTLSRIAAKFPSVPDLFKKNEMAIEEIYNMLRASNTYTNPQRLFIMLRSGYRNDGYSPNLGTYSDIADYVSFVDYLFKEAQEKDQIVDVVDAYVHPFKGYADKKIYLFAKQLTLECEQADEAIENWIGEDGKKRSFIKHFGYKDSFCSELIRRQKFLDNEKQEYTITDNECNRSFLEWSITQSSPFTLNRIDVLRFICKTNQSFASECWDFDKLKSNSVEWDDDEYKRWSIGTPLKIFLYEGKMPSYGRYVKLDGTTIRIYEYANGEYLRDGNTLYINSTNDISQILAVVSSDANIPFSKDDWNTIFRDTTDLVISLAKKNEELKSVIEELRRQLKDKDKGATIGTSIGEGINNTAQIDENNEAKELVLAKLEKKGFDVSDADSDWSVIKGVTRDGVTYPLVVKSCKNWDNKLYLNPEEWRQLFKPNSMLWIHKGNGEITPIKAYELFTYQDKISLTFDTINLMMDDRINKIMEVMRYFNNVHLEVATLNPDLNRAEHLEYYLFNANNADNSDLTASPID